MINQAREVSMGIEPTSEAWEALNKYADKGFVLRNDETLGLIKESMKNVMALLVAKLSASS
jgi:hypothetical protein